MGSSAARATPRAQSATRSASCSFILARSSQGERRSAAYPHEPAPHGSEVHVVYCCRVGPVPKPTSAFDTGMSHWAQKYIQGARQSTVQNSSVLIGVPSGIISQNWAARELARCVAGVQPPACPPWGCKVRPGCHSQGKRLHGSLACLGQPTAAAEGRSGRHALHSNEGRQQRR